METKKQKLIKIKLQTKLPEKVERLSESKNHKLFPVNFKILINVLYTNLNIIVLILRSMDLTLQYKQYTDIYSNKTIIKPNL